MHGAGGSVHRPNVSFAHCSKGAQPTWRALGVLWLTWLYRRPSCTISPAYTASCGGGVTLASFWVVICRQGGASVVGGAGAAGFAPNAGLLLPWRPAFNAVQAAFLGIPWRPAVTAVQAAAHLPEPHLALQRRLIVLYRRTAERPLRW